MTTKPRPLVSRSTARTKKKQDRSRSKAADQVPALVTTSADLVPAHRDVFVRRKDNDLVVLSGPPGTGKTFLAVRLAVTALAAGEVKKIYLLRPAVEAGERLGFLPGDIREKLHPYMVSVFEFLADHGLEGEKMLDDGLLEVVPLAFTKGRTFSGFVIVDEAQDLSAKSLRLVVGRLGRDSKMVITGDPGQTDCPETPNAFFRMCTRLRVDPPDGVLFAQFTDAHVLRHRLVPSLLKLCE